MSEDDAYLPKSNLEDYPVNREFYKPIDALDVKKTNQTWEAFVKCDSEHGIKMRFYRWKKEKNAVNWAVNARFDVDHWNLENIIRFLTKK